MIEGYTLTKHAEFQIQERQISISWIEKALLNPDQVISLADIHGNTHYTKRIEEFGNRYLRVIVNPLVDPHRIVTIFFDRRLKK